MVTYIFWSDMCSNESFTPHMGTEALTLHPQTCCTAEELRQEAIGSEHVSRSSGCAGLAAGSCDSTMSMQVTQRLCREIGRESL